MTQKTSTEIGSSFTSSVNDEPLNLYCLLQISSDADEQDLKRRINQYYLDAQQNLDHRNAKKRLHFQQMYEIYLPQARRILLDPQRRAEYDHFLLSHETASHASTQPSSQSIQNQVVTQDTQASQALAHSNLEAERMMLWQQWQGDLAIALAESEKKLAATFPTVSPQQSAHEAASQSVVTTPRTGARRVEPKRSWSVETVDSNSSSTVTPPPQIVTPTPQGISIKVEHLVAVAGVAIVLFGFLLFRSASTASPVPVSTISQPFRGAPAVIPGIVQAEDYDQGGEGLAYSDASTQDQGGGYRNGSVGIGNIAQGQYYVGWTQSGEWIQYTIEAETSGKYLINVRLMTRKPARFSVQVDGEDVASDITVPDTAGFWQNLPLGPVTIAKGRHSVRLLIRDDSINFDWLRFSSAL